MTWLQYGALGTIIVGGVGGYAVTSVMASVREQDLSVIGNGTPAVVQIHDPSCQQCADLQREARAALSDTDPDDLQFLVANLSSTTGSEFAQQYAVGHVTLMLMDGDGQVVEILRGTRNRSELRDRFAAFLAAQ